MVPWSRETVQWQPLCSHVSLSECSPGDFDASSPDGIRLVGISSKEEHLKDALNAKESLSANRHLTHRGSLTPAKQSSVSFGEALLKGSPDMARDVVGVKAIFVGC